MWEFYSLGFSLKTRLKTHIYTALYNMESAVKFLRLALISIIFITAFGKDKHELLECPEVTFPVIIPAVNMIFSISMK